MGALGRGVLFNIALNAFRHATLGCFFFRSSSSDTRAMVRFMDVAWYNLNGRIRNTPDPFLVFYLILHSMLFVTQHWVSFFFRSSSSDTMVMGR